MQRQILILPFVFLFFCSAIEAQSIFSFGVKAGANFSTFTGEGADGSDALIAPHGGGLVNFAATNAEGFFKYVVQAEILYSMQGVKSGNDKTTLSYINVPIMVQRYIDASGFYIETGPQAGFLIGAKQKVDGSKTDIKSELKTFDFSVNFGLGYRFNQGIGIGARYGLEITPINKSGSGHDFKNAVISAGLFYEFGSRSWDYQ
jgi:hypothetical protein